MECSHHRIHHRIRRMPQASRPDRLRWRLQAWDLVSTLKASVRLSYYRFVDDV